MTIEGGTREGDMIDLFCLPCLQLDRYFSSGAAHLIPVRTERERETVRGPWTEHNLLKTLTMRNRRTV